MTHSCHIFVNFHFPVSLDPLQLVSCRRAITESDNCPQGGQVNKPDQCVLTIDKTDTLWNVIE